MFRVSIFLAAGIAALGMALAAPNSAQAAPAPGSACGSNMVVNTHGQCLRVGSFCSMSDGMVVGVLGPDGRCVIPGTNI